MPVNNTRLYVADSFRRLLPIGAMGELLIAGTQIPVSQLLSIIIAAAAICLILIFRTRAVRQKT